MFYRFAIVAGLAFWASDVEAQVGLAASASSVALAATKPASVSVSLSGGASASIAGALAARTSGVDSVAVTTAWDLEPERTAAVTLVAYLHQRALAGDPTAASRRVPTGGPQSYERLVASDLAGRAQAPGVPGPSRVLFHQTVSGANSAGRRTDHLQVRITPIGAAELRAGSHGGTLDLVAITQ